MASRDGSQQPEGVPHPTTNIEQTRRMMHPTQPGLMSAIDAMHYNNTMVIAQQNRQTHNMLEQLLAQGVGRRARS
jgi:hypothetical protein